MKRSGNSCFKNMILIKYTKIAQKDLVKVFTVIYNDKQNTAKEYLVKMKKNIELLSYNPEMGVDCKKKSFKGDCRVLYYENYMILYKIYKNYISIKRVINTKQNYKG